MGKPVLLALASMLSELISTVASPLNNRVDSRKRNLQFQLPAIVHVGQLCRLVESDSSVTSLQDIYERYCEDVGMDKDDPIMAYVEKFRSLMAALPKTVSCGLGSGCHQLKQYALAIGRQRAPAYGCQAGCLHRDRDEDVPRHYPARCTLRVSTSDAFDC